MPYFSAARIKFSLCLNSLYTELESPQPRVFLLFPRLSELILRALWIFSAQKHLSNHSSKCVEIEAARFFCKVKCDWQILPRKLFKTCLLLRRPPQADANYLPNLLAISEKYFDSFSSFKSSSTSTLPLVTFTSITAIMRAKNSRAEL